MTTKIVSRVLWTVIVLSAAAGCDSRGRIVQPCPGDAKTDVDQNASYALYYKADGTLLDTYIEDLTGNTSRKQMCPITILHTNPACDPNTQCTVHVDGVTGCKPKPPSGC